MWGKKTHRSHINTKKLEMDERGGHTFPVDQRLIFLKNCNACHGKKVVYICLNQMWLHIPTNINSITLFYLEIIFTKTDSICAYIGFKNAFRNYIEVGILVPNHGYLMNILSLGSLGQKKKNLFSDYNLQPSYTVL